MDEAPVRRATAEPTTPPAALAMPASSEEVREIVRGAVAESGVLRVSAGEHWLDAGAPVHSHATLSLAGMRGIVDYVPGDLTLTAGAGTPLSEIARVTAPERQWLALDPGGDATGTLGATVATGSSGPLAAGFGPVRDAILGLEIVTGKGDIVRGGGRVVKNVAGFDLPRLFTGSWGTLGVVTEVTVRLRALPEGERTLAVALDGAAAVNDALRAVRRWSVAPMAAQLLSPPLAARLGLGQRTLLIVRLAGNTDALAALLGMVAALGRTEELDPCVWSALATCEPPGAPVVRVSAAPASLAGLWAEVSGDAAANGAMLHGCVVRGVVRCIVPRDGDTAGADRALEALAATPRTRVAERLPDEWWPRFVREPMHDRLARRARDAFDPSRVLNRGILGPEP